MRREGYRWESRPWRPSDVQERILDGVSRGKTNPQIAAEVGMTLDGVKWHISRALAETGLSDRQSLARWWQGGPLRMTLAEGTRSQEQGTRARYAPVRPVSLDYVTSMRAMWRSHGAADTRGYGWRLLTPPAEPSGPTQHELLVTL
jgi:DNA-binding CsgD family transcriptional regulator